MITGFFLTLLLTFITFVVGFLPTTAFPAAFETSINLIWGYVNLFSMVVPVSTITTLLGIVMSYYTALFAWDAFHWVLRRLKR